MKGQGLKTLVNGQRHVEKRKHSDLEEESDEFSSAEDVDDDICGLDDYLSSDDSDFRVKHSLSAIYKLIVK